MTAAAFEVALRIYVEQQLTHGVGTKSAANLSLKHCTIILMMLCNAPVVALYSLGGGAAVNAGTSSEELAYVGVSMSF